MLKATDDKTVNRILFFIILIKLWLIADKSLNALGFAGHDDALFFRLGVTIYEGKWLGDYNHLTLIKGPFFPIFIALSYITGLSLMVCEQLLYIAGCLLVIRVFKQEISNRYLTILFFSVLLFNPMLDGIDRIIRESIYPALGILTLFSFAKFLIDHDGKDKLKYKWAVISGIFLSAFWLTREDSIWIIPPLGILAVYFLIKEGLRLKKMFQPKRILFTSIPFLVLFVAITIVSLINKAYYNVYEVVEFKNKQFIRAYSALTRVEHGERIDYIPVTIETRKLLYHTVPAFAELKEAEEPIFQAWAKSNPYCSSKPETCGETAGGWFMWAFRDAVASKGYYTDGKKAESYYKRLADEINDACDCGKLKCLPERNSMIPRIDQKTFNAFIKSFFYSWHYVATYRDVSFKEGESSGDPAVLYSIQEFTRHKLAQKQMQESNPIHRHLGIAKRNLFKEILKVYKFIVPVAFYSALLLFLVISYRSIKNKNIPVNGILALAILVACGCRLAILALVHVTSFPAVDSNYASPVHPLFIIFIVIVFIESYKLYQARKNAN